MPNAKLTDEERFEEVDAMPANLRSLVHEYGFELVADFTRSGITKPGLIHKLIQACWAGARNQKNRTGDAKVLFGESPAMRRLDWLLVQNGSPISAAAVLRLLRDAGMVIVPMEPNGVMLAASIAFTDGAGPLTKQAKHQGRLRAAILTGAKGLWPFLFNDPKGPTP